MNLWSVMQSGVKRWGCAGQRDMVQAQRRRQAAIISPDLLVGLLKDEDIQLILGVQEWWNLLDLDEERIPDHRGLSGKD